MSDRLAAQLEFLEEADRLKSVIRRNYLADGSRRETTAEHSWYLALMALVLVEHADAPVDLARVVAMVLVHDLVEIDAGDAWIHDPAAQAAKVALEAAAAERLFSLLPPDQGSPLRGLFEEYEAQETAEARFAASLDRMAPVLLNAWSDGRAWRELEVSAEQVRSVAQRIAPGSTALHAAAEVAIDQAVVAGHLAP